MGYAPIRLKGTVQNPNVVFHQALHRSSAMGYVPEVVDPRHRCFRVRAYLDQRGRRNRVSWFTVMVQPDGSVNVVAEGYHVRYRNGVIHRKLCRELTAYLDGLTPALGHPPRVVGLYHGA